MGDVPDNPGRRELIGLAAAVPLVALAPGVLASGALAAAAPQAPSRENIGVCVHLNDTGSAYHDLAKVLACVRFIGVEHLRTAAPQRNTLGNTLLGKAAAAGCKFTFTMRHNRPFGDEIADLEAFAATNRSSIAAIEGPNEIDHSPVAFNGRKDSKEDAYGNPAAALDYQAALYNAIQTSRSLRGIPLIAFSDFAQGQQRANYSNMHMYPRNGKTLASKLPGMQQALTAVDRPVIITETGFHTLPSAKPFPGTDEATQAVLIRDAVLSAPAAGVVRTFLYELLDGYPPDDKMDTHFGLFRYDYSPKRAAAVVRQLLVG